MGQTTVSSGIMDKKVFLQTAKKCVFLML